MREQPGLKRGSPYLVENEDKRQHTEEQPPNPSGYALLVEAIANHRRGPLHTGYGAGCRHQWAKRESMMQACLNPLAGRKDRAFKGSRDVREESAEDHGLKPAPPKQTLDDVAQQANWSSLLLVCMVPDHHKGVKKRMPRFCLSCRNSRRPRPHMTPPHSQQ